MPIRTECQRTSKSCDDKGFPATRQGFPPAGFHENEGRMKSDRLRNIINGPSRRTRFAMARLCRILRRGMNSRASRIPVFPFRTRRDPAIRSARAAVDHGCRAVDATGRESGLRVPHPLCGIGDDVQDRGVIDGRRHRILLSIHDLAHGAPQDLARPRLRKCLHDRGLLEAGQGPSSERTSGRAPPRSPPACARRRLQHDEATGTWPLSLSSAPGRAIRDILVPGDDLLHGAGGKPVPRTLITSSIRPMIKM